MQLSNAHASESFLSEGDLETCKSLQTSSLGPLSESTKTLAQHDEGNRNIFWNVCSFILITELCERLAFYGLTGSLVIFFTDRLGLDSNLSSQLLSLFSSITYAAPLFGAYVADQLLGRYLTILIFSIMYVSGLFMCTYASDPYVLGDDPERASTKSIVIFFIALFGGVALGSGGIKPNVVVLGAEQFDTSKPSEAAQQQSYFNYFYWSINIGASFSFGYLAWLATHGAPPLISENYGFFASFFIPSCFMAIAVLTFFLGRNRYKKMEPSGSALKNFLGVLFESARGMQEGRAILEYELKIRPLWWLWSRQ